MLVDNDTWDLVPTSKPEKKSIGHCLGAQAQVDYEQNGQLVQGLVSHQRVCIKWT